MAFHFVLAPLLRLRQSVERQRALQLREASWRVRQMQDKLQQLDRFLSDSQSIDQQRLRAGVKGAEIRFAAMTREQLQKLRAEIRVDIARLEVARQEAVAEYQQACRQREVLATLRQQQRRQYQQEELRRQQREIDVAHLLQRWRNR